SAWLFRRPARRRRGATPADNGCRARTLLTYGLSRARGGIAVEAGSILGARRLLSSARGAIAVAPERSRPGRGSADQIGAGMATTYALPAIADRVAARAPPRPLVLRTVAIAGLLTAIGSLALALTNDGVSGI